MQISDEQVAAYKAAYNAEMARWSFEGGHIDPSFEASRVGLAAALSLPVQPVAWTPYQIMLIIHYHVSGAPFYLSQAPIWRATVDDLVAQGILAMREELFCYQTTAKGDALVKSWQSTTPPAPPTKGPEDDLIAALERIRKLVGNARGLYAKLACEKIDALLALRSRPASALPVVGEDALTEFAKHRNWELSCGEDPQIEGEMRWQVHSVNGGRNDREWTLIGTGDTPEAAIRSALIPSVQP